jgi:hypothetical protein
MRVLAYTHTFNSADVIGETLNGFQHQTRPPDAIQTLDRTFPEQVSVSQNAANLDTSGAVSIGLGHALERGFDWTPTAFPSRRHWRHYSQISLYLRGIWHGLTGNIAVHE